MSWNYLEIESYFESLGNHADVNHAIFGTYEELADWAKSRGRKEKPPVLFIPEYDTRQDQNKADFRHEYLDMMLFLYAPWGKKESFQDRANTLAALEPIIREVVGKMEEDINACEIFPITQDFTYRGKGFSISDPLFGSKWIGWGFEFEFLQHSKTYHNPDKWL